MIRGDTIKGLPLISKLSPACVEDQSANGTFLNGKRLEKGEQVSLKEGDRLSLVLSLSPMLERSFIFRMGGLCCIPTYHYASKSSGLEEHIILLPKVRRCSNRTATR